MSVEKSNIVTHAKWVSFGTIAQAMIQIITLAFLARALSPNEFGIIATATLIIQLIFIFSDFGILTFIVQRKSISPVLVATGYNFSMLIGIIITVILFSASTAISFLFNSPELSNVLRLYSIYLILGCISATHIALLQRSFKYRELAVADIVSYTIGYCCISLTLAWAGFSYWSMVIGHISQATIKLAIIDKGISRKNKHFLNAQYTKEYIRFGVGQSLSRIGSYMAGQIDSVIIAYKLGMAPIGIYSRAHQLASIPANQLGSIFDKLIFPYLSRRQDNTKLSQIIYCRNLGAVTLIGIIAIIFIWSLSDTIVFIVLGDGWEPVVGTLNILSLAIPLKLIQHVSDPTARAFGSTYRRAWRQWLFAILTGVASLYLSQYGIESVAIGVVATSTINSLLMIGLCANLLQCKLHIVLISLLPAIVLSSIYLVLCAAFNKIGSPLFGTVPLLITICGLLFVWVFALKWRAYFDEIF